MVFGICWFSFAETQAILLHHYGLSWRTALIDGAITYTILACVALLIAVTLQHFIPQRNRYTYLIGLVVVLCIIWMVINRAVLLLVIGSDDYQQFFNASIVIRFAFGLLILGCITLISVLYYTQQEQQEITQRKMEAEALSKEAELYKLRQQLQPHFLFNSLNSINALITLQPQQARKMIEQLSDFLRSTLKKEENQWSSLEEEIKQLQLYLDIEKVRFGHRLSTIIESEAGSHLQIPSMLLQPVVENAIKFGLYDLTGVITITIHTEQRDQNLIVTITNPYDETTSEQRKGVGFGLASVQRRLYLLFAKNDLLKTEGHRNIFTTSLTIPQKI